MLENALQKEDYRDAYYQLMKASEYSGGQFENMDALIYDARMKGISRVIVEVNNQYAPAAASAGGRGSDLF